MADQAQSSTPEPTEKERIAEAKAHAASRIKKEMAVKERNVEPSSDAALLFSNQKEGSKTSITLKEREKELAERMLTIAPRSSILKIVSS